MAKRKEQGSADNNTNLNKSEAFFNKYKNQLIAVVAVLVIIIAGWFVYEAYVSGPREDKASTALARGQEYFNQEQFDVALKGDSAGFKGFLGVISDYGSTKAGNLARLYAGLCYANLNKWNDAVKYLDEYSPADDAMVSPAAIAALGNAYAHVKQVDKAVKYLNHAADMADKQSRDGANISLSPTFRLQAGILLESQGKNQEALKTYQDIKKKYVNAALVQSSEIDKYIERVSLK